MKDICKKDVRFKEVVKECHLVKNAVSLLGGRRKEKGKREEKDGKADREGEGGKGEEEKGAMEVEFVEMKVGEKISLIELLSELVKGGVEIKEEEEMKEVLMELEEEGNKHVEEEMEEGEEKEGEKMEWEELSEKACMLVRMMEKMKNRREGKKSGTLKMMMKEKEEMEKKVEEAEKGREEERRGREEEKKKVKEEKKKREEEKRAF